MWELVNGYLGALITLLGSVLFIKYVLNELIKIGKIRFVILILFFTLIFETLFLFDIKLIRTFICFVSYVFLFKYVFKSNNIKAILSSFAFVITVTISEILVFVILTYLFKIDYAYLYNNFAGSAFSNFIVSFLTLILGRLFKPWIIKIVKIKIKNIVVLYTILIFIAVIGFFYIAFSNINFDFSFFLSVAIICLMLVVIFSLFNQSYKNNQLTDKYDKLLEFIQKYEFEIEKQRMLRHETKNQLLTIKSKIIDKDALENVISYIDEILEENKSIKNMEYAKFKFLPSNGIKGLLYFKVNEATSKGIKVELNVSKAIEQSFLYTLNANLFNQLGKLLGIFLDNAIESAQFAKDKKMGIEIYGCNDKVTFIISNTYSGKTAFSQSLFLHSSKGDGRGYGLLLAKTIINGNDKFSSTTEITDKLYIQRLSIKK